MPQWLEIFLSVLLSSGIIVFVLKLWLSGKIKYFFEKELESYKHKLEIATEEARYQYSRKIQEFSLYVSKKHEKYLKLYRLVLEAHGRIFGLYGFRTEPTYEECNLDDIKNKLEKEGFYIGKVDEIVNIWENRGRENAIEEMKNILRVKELRLAETAIIEARNFYILSEVYLSKKVDAITKNTLDKLYSLFNKYELIDKTQKGERFRETLIKLSDEADKLKVEIESSIKDFKITIKEELSASYHT